MQVAVLCREVDRLRAIVGSGVEGDPPFGQPLDDKDVPTRCGGVDGLYTGGEG